MTSIGDLVGSLSDKLTQDNIDIGSVYMLRLDKTNGITPKNGDTFRDKFFVVLGLNEDRVVVGGLVINSNINKNLPATVTDYYLQIPAERYPFLKHDSFVNCSKLIVANKDKFTRSTYCGEITDSSFLESIYNTVKESPTVSNKQLKMFGIE